MVAASQNNWIKRALTLLLLSAVVLLAGAAARSAVPGVHVVAGIASAGEESYAQPLLAVAHAEAQLPGSGGVPDDPNGATGDRLPALDTAWSPARDGDAPQTRQPMQATDAPRATGRPAVLYPADQLDAWDRQTMLSGRFGVAMLTLLEAGDAVPKHVATSSRGEGTEGYIATSPDCIAQFVPSRWAQTTAGTVAASTEVPSAVQPTQRIAQFVPTRHTDTQTTSPAAQQGTQTTLPPEMDPLHAATQQSRMPVFVHARQDGVLSAQIQPQETAWPKTQWMLANARPDGVQPAPTAPLGPTPAPTQPPLEPMPTPEPTVTPRPGPTPTYEYESDDVRIEIIRHEEPNLVYYAIELWVSDVTQLRSAFSMDQFNSSTEPLQDIALRNNAILAFNGDFSTFNNGGIIIRNGELYRDNRSTRQLMVIDRNGDFIAYTEPPENSKEVAAQFIADGVWQTLVFGPVLVDRGEAVPLPGKFFISTRAQEPRTAVGQLGPLHYLVLVVDGRIKEHSQGVSLGRLQEMFLEYGAISAFNLDGGGSTTLFFDGEIINRPANGGQRHVPDMLYIERGE